MKCSFLPARARTILLLAVLRGGAVIKNMCINALKNLRCNSEDGAARMCYLEREFSFDERRPVFSFKMPRRTSSSKLSIIPCVSRHRDHSAEFDKEDDWGDTHIDEKCDVKEESYLSGDGSEGEEEEEEEEEGEIDSKAEEFIARFYEEMKMQRQDSSLSAAVQ